MYLPKSYLKCREEFIDAATKIGAICSNEFLQVKGMDNTRLSIDFAKLGNLKAERALVVLSGVHGIEGYCGSAIQTNFLTHFDAKDKALDNVCIFFIHAVNPYGFYNDRRTNEDNIDLNRNFNINENFNILNDDYKIIHPFLCPKDWSEITKGQTKIALEKIKKDLSEKYIKAVAGGQSEYATGLFYSGNSLSWSVDILLSWKNVNLTNMKDICVIDLHSGLGKYGNGQLQTADDPDSIGFKRMKRWFGNVYNPREGEIAVGEAVPYKTNGSVAKGLIDNLPNANTCQAVLEFGTRPFEEVLDALRAENCLYHFGPFEDEIEKKIHSAMKSAFCPQDEKWFRAVINRGQEVIELAIKGLNEISK